MKRQALETQIPEAVHCDWGTSFETVMNSDEQASSMLFQHTRSIQR